MTEVYKFNSIFAPVLLTFSLISSGHSCGSGITSNTTGVAEKLRIWLWGPAGTITVHGVNETSESDCEPNVQDVALIYMEPKWINQSHPFPASGMEGVLVKANPSDACYNLEDPPKEFTSSEYSLEEDEGNTSRVVKHWFLVADDGYCDYETKIRNADMSGYSILILRTNSNSEEDTSSEEFNNTVILLQSGAPGGVSIFTCTVSDDDGYLLQENYAYPMSYTATVKDVRPFQLSHAAGKITGLALGAVALAALIPGIIYAALKKKASLKAAADAKDELPKRIAKDLPSEKWKLDEKNFRERCQLCHQRFNYNDDFTTLPCSHKFHKTCLVPRILNGHAYCPICNTEIHALPIPETEPEDDKQTEKTPLLQLKDTPPPDDKGLRYHCHICEILGLPLKDELEIISELSLSSTQDSRQLRRLLSRQQSAISSSSISFSVVGTELDEENEVEEKVQVIL